MSLLKDEKEAGLDRFEVSQIRKGRFSVNNEGGGGGGWEDDGTGASSE